uniref:ILK associated serine/threonine phosphatase n=1 Tax=Pipistrellus kuhlii TaxID=59472 RepID=A0A7J7XUQ4_PIPKU|nr:ILK associated serine/threonine phosphatase [Pipistrellus kuhlii]
MDLFGDLPEPERSPAAGKEAQKGSLLFDDLPPASSTDSGTVFRLSQDQADLCFLMTSHQPAVASQVSSREKCNVLVEIIHILLLRKVYL